VYTYLRDFDTALYYYTRTDRRINDLRPNMRIYFLNNFGNFYFFKQDYKMALKQFRRVVKTLHEYGMDNSLDMKICRVNMADVFQNLNRTTPHAFILPDWKIISRQTNLMPVLIT
jgi:tetratricopeptide (TPR) repeat protein